MIEFVCASYNEQEQIAGLIEHVTDYVDRIIIADDGSTDETIKEIVNHREAGKITLVQLEHTGLPETVKKAAVEQAYDNSWILMLDCDERFEDGALPKIVREIPNLEAWGYTHVWFSLIEFIDNIQTKGFAKCRLFKKECVKFSDLIHKDEEFSGKGIVSKWRILHRKTSQKQITREYEYIETYRKLLRDKKIDENTFNSIVSNHYFIKADPYD